MSITRRALVGLTGLAACEVALAGCSGGPSDGSGGDAEATIGEAQSVGAMEDFGVGTTFKATEPVDFSLMYRDHTNYPVQDDWSVFRHLKDDHNVTFTRTDIPMADYDQKKSLLIGSGEATDIISVTYGGTETQFITGGTILPVSRYFQYMPNFQQKIKDWGLQEDLDNKRQADGRIYHLPGLREAPDVQYSVVIREDLWERAGLTEDPATWDEFQEQLLQVKEANPEIDYAMSDRWTDATTLGSLLSVIAVNYGTLAGWGYANTYYDEGAGKFVFNGTTDQYREVVSYAAGLIAAGALDPEITQTDDQATQKFISGKSAAISGNTQTLVEYRTKFADAGKGDVPIRLISLPSGPSGSNLPSGRFTSGLLISAKASEQPYFKALLQFVDWLYYSDEGLEFAQWGVEGETFTRAADGTRVLNEDISWSSINAGAPKLLNADFGYSNGVFLVANGSSKDLVFSMMTDEIAEWTELQLAANEQLPVAPAAQLDEIELEQTSLLQTQLTDAVQAATAAFITGQRSIDDEWSAYVTETEGLGATQLIDTINAALERA
ncbi:extracellular solute-binding protein [Glycomyces algeriensis]|uniref:Sugar ABC transporter substrate-binding protein n=1 Tax=Glycomyces algeriensis TaxID=256037 RepID=A0A9W6GA06_9ACTN|nr:extracellular solute-binding protein [Glycomyces algeriensis]MDA1365672.1 extracellular solute-binding protein [Glycomyces algeriensis]MDR7351360.1 putative aldouronate transport system substrate-binding protein [Glycomyces algeriensis]GLI44075.1 sugar ABC transporter substrate-binding protein [Glycomyces algeriensis]